MLAWEAFLYFALLDGVALLGMNHLLIAHKQNIERFLSRVTGDQPWPSNLEAAGKILSSASGLSLHEVRHCTLVQAAGRCSRMGLME